MNKRFNKWVVLLMVVTLLSAFVVGCGNSQNEEPQQQQEPQVEQVTIEQVADDYYANMPENIYKIDSQELKDRIDSNDDSMLIISIRSPEDYAKGHIQGAVNIPFKKVHEYIDQLPADKELIVYCYTGQTAGQTVAILNMYGYNARSVDLGFDKGWLGKYDFPVETTPNELPDDAAPAEPDAQIAQILKAYFANMPEDIHKIDAAPLQEKIEAGEEMQVVDIRKAEDFAKGNIKGAINIPFAEVNQHFEEFAKDKPVYVYCYSGQTAGQTVAVLNVLGINALSVSGGFNFGWVDMPVEQ